MTRLKIAACVLSVIQIVAIVLALNGSEVMQEALKVWLVVLIVGGLGSGCLKARSHALDWQEPAYVARRLSRERFEQQMGSLDEGLVLHCVTTGLVVIEPEDGGLGDGEVLSTEEADRCLRSQWCYAAPEQISEARRMLGLESDRAVTERVVRG